jgi:hypothetical protein
LIDNENPFLVFLYKKEVEKVKKPFYQYVSWYLIVAMFIIGITPRVFAGFSGSEILGISIIDRASDLQKIQKFLEMKMIRERLKELGFTPEEIQRRLDDLSDLQIHQIALQLDELKVGGDGLGIVIALLLIAVLVVLIIYLLGHRIVVK